jgi:PAS domain-containing protein
MPWYSEDGRLLGAIESLRDVTERHTILQNHKQWLRESEGQGKQLIAALNSLGASVLTYDKNGKINAVTEAMASWLGYQKSSQLVGKELKIVLGARAAKKLLNSQPNIDSLEWICKDGSKMTAAVEVQNIPHESQFSGGMIRIL